MLLNIESMFMAILGVVGEVHNNEGYDHYHANYCYLVAIPHNFIILRVHVLVEGPPLLFYINCIIMALVVYSDYFYHKETCSTTNCCHKVFF